MKKLFILSIVFLIMLGCEQVKQNEPSKTEDTFICATKITSLVDVHESTEQTDSYVAAKMRMDTSLIKRIVRMATSGKIRVYNEYTDSIPLSIDEINRRLAPVIDTMAVESIDPGEGMKTVIVKMDRIENMDFIQFVEDWDYDTINATISQKVIAYALSYQSTDEKGNSLGIKNYFWVKK